MGVAVPWLTLMMFQAWQHGAKQKKMPEPFYFIGGSAVMTIGAIVGMANPTAGALFNWAMVLGAFVSGQAKFVPAGSEAGPETPQKLTPQTFEQTPPNMNGVPLGLLRTQYGP